MNLETLVSQGRQLLARASAGKADRLAILDWLRAMHTPAAYTVPTSELVDELADVLAEYECDVCGAPVAWQHDRPEPTCDCAEEAGAEQGWSREDYERAYGPHAARARFEGRADR